MRNLRLSEICNRITDGSHNPPKGVNNSDFLMISSKNIFDDKITLDEPRYLTEQDFIIEHNRTQIKSGDILLTIVGTVGRVAVFDDKIGKITLQRSVAVLHPNTEICNSRYLMYLLRAKRYKFEQGAKGVAQKGIYLKELANTELSIVDRSEQDKIVTILDNLTELITSSENQIKAYDTLIKSRFVEMFGDPVYNPMQWPVKKLGDLSLQINSGNTPKGGEQVYVNKGITFFRSQNVWKDRLEMDDIAYIDEATHVSMNRSSLKHGDILMTKTGRINTENSSLGRAALYMGEDDVANVNGHVYFIRLRGGVNNKFILRILVSDEYKDYIRNVCVGGIDKRQLNKDHIENFPIICPPKSMIEEYIMFVKQIDKLKFEQQQQLEKTQILFDSLMQQYFG